MNKTTKATDYIGWRWTQSILYHRMRSRDAAKAACGRRVDAVNGQGIPPQGYQACGVCFPARKARGQS